MKKILAVLVAVLLLVAGCEETPQTNEQIKPYTGKEMLVHFIDVGQGDSILIQSPNGKTMLVDAGVKGAGKTVVDYLEVHGVQKLDYVVATHPDADHIGGLIPVLNSIPVEHFMDSGKIHTSNTYEEMLTLIHEKNIPFTIPQTGDLIELDSEVTVNVLSADEDAADNNEASIVLRVAYGNISFLLTGDAGIDMEKEMLANGLDVEATILKAGHHGSNTSSSQTFVNAVSPLATILSYGQNNKYGHPHAEVIDALQNVGSDIYSTAEAGTIVVNTDGDTYKINQSQWTGIGATSEIKIPNVIGSVELVSKDVQAEVVVVKNTGKEAVNMQGWQLVSVEGNQVFNFPNIDLAPGTSISITSGSDAKTGENELEWTKRQIWLNTGDSAHLMNAKGEIVSELP
ncbi:competence protein [Solibacillus sp. R5-41]|uniref:MBL fold metallo-hydrolase n=1 Tax=Solibacillus sp. R5-41 TaxID=2048654 RepID=UPI000C127651|nr:MBL fold metallo-hydrolase [Solibacillus sp. R5-41]ATP41796.1 competence protein [Solibacillus sp. R5-41]